MIYTGCDFILHMTTLGITVELNSGIKLSEFFPWEELTQIVDQNGCFHDMIYPTDGSYCNSCFSIDKSMKLIILKTVED